MIAPAPLRWGLLGTGAIASKFAYALERTETGKFQAVASRKLQRAKNFRAIHDVVSVYGSYDELLADPLVDVVYIATPHPWHAEWAIRAAAAGKHILCEKPLAMNHADALRMVEAARSAKVFLMEAYMYRAHPQTARLLEILRSGVIGEPRSMRASFSFAGDYDPRSRLFDPKLGGGAILDVGGYPVSMARLVAGAMTGKNFADPVRVEGVGQIGKTGVDEQAIGLLQFPGGFQAQISCGIRVAEEQELVIYGTEGRLNLPSPWFCGTEGGGAAIEVSLKKHHRRDFEIVPAPQKLYLYEIDTVAAHRADGEAPCMTLEDSLGNMRTLDRWREAVFTENEAPGS